MQKLLRASADNYSSCSAAVGEAMTADIMRTVRHVVYDVLDANLPLLLYQASGSARTGLTADA